MKDIFIDNNVAKNFATPIDPHYKKLIEWINEFDENIVKKDPKKKLDFAHLVVSQKLLVEYTKSARNCSKLNVITAIIGRLTIEGRIVKKSKEEIEEFMNKHFTKSRVKSLLSNVEDYIHIVCVLLSNRKLCLTYDENLTKDLIWFPQHSVTVSERPEKLNYR